MIYCGIDWAERTHDVALVDDTGQLLAKRHITDDAAGYSNLMDLLAEYGDTEETPIPVAIETSRGLLVAVLRASKRKVFAINPMAAARYRDRHAVSRKKSDPGDALVLANILRTDMHAHRPLPNDSDLARAITVLARAQQDAVWHRQQVANQLRSLLREHYPAALEAFAKWDNSLCRPEARELMKLAPTPARAASLTRTQITAALKRAGRKRGIESDVERLREAFRTDWAVSPSLSRMRSASRRSPYSDSSRPPAPPPPTSPRLSRRRSRNTRTPKLSSASPASVSSLLRGCWPKSETTAPDSRTPAA